MRHFNKCRSDLTVRPTGRCRCPVGPTGRFGVTTQAFCGWFCGWFYWQMHLAVKACLAHVLCQALSGLGIFLVFCLFLSSRLFVVASELPSEHAAGKAFLRRGKHPQSTHPERLGFVGVSANPGNIWKTCPRLHVIRNQILDEFVASDIFRDGSFIAFVRQDHCIAHEIFHHVK